MTLDGLKACWHPGIIAELTVCCREDNILYQEVLRLCLLSDTHGTVNPKIRQIASECEIAVHAGDIGNASVLQALQPKSGQVVAVAGNNDYPAAWPAADQTLLETLPEQVVLPLPGGDLVVEHGDKVNPVAERHEKFRARFPKARAILYGHSHQLVCDQEQMPWVLNPGAAGRARTYGGPSCLVLTISPQAWSVEAFRFALDEFE